MTDRIRCNLYHDFDGHCCDKDEPCALLPVKTLVRPPLAPPPMMNYYMAILMFTATMLAITVVGVTELEKQQARIDRANQEIVQW